MIPVRLKVRNFMCYRENVPDLRFDGIRTACVSGENGSGKSALIDAITWALWGKTRSKSDDELVNSGRSDMEVEFDFRAGGQLYRIIRKHSKPRRQSRSGHTLLEFQIAAGDAFKPITGENVTQTQQKIAGVLHMDYDTFINSAFLRQGHADEFTTKRPVERKQILAGILGLSVYDELEEEAKEIARQRETEKSQLESAITEIDEELCAKPAWEAERQAALAELAAAESRLKEQESGLAALRRQKEALEAKRSQLAELEENNRITEKATADWEEQAKRHHARIGEYEALLSRRAEIEQGYSRLAETKRLCSALDQKLREAAALGSRKHRLEIAITQAGQTLVSEHRLAQSRIVELETAYGKLAALRSELAGVEAKKAELSGQEAALRARMAESREKRTRLHSLDSEQVRLRQEIAATDEKLSLLHDKTDRCPLCETELGMDGRQRIEQKYRADKLAISDKIRTIQSELAASQAELELAERETERLEKRLVQERGAAQARGGMLAREIEQAGEAGEKLAEARKRLEGLEEQLARRDFARSEQEALAKIEQELDALGYSQEEHDAARGSLSTLEQFEEPKRKLDEAALLLESEREALSRAASAAAEQRQRLENDKQRREELLSELEALPSLASALSQAQAEFESLLERQRGSRERLGSVRARLERCAELEGKRREKAERLEQAAKEEGIYRELAKAFGKGGIQAQLIETALPEIEIEANRLLGRMTDSRMSIKFDTQRETKKGDVIETLDINICDELGHTRNYEMFSGGEAFRIDFAIRIALSRLLARRAGAPLPTLIIDEGFGTQDSTGIEKLKEAINSIQDDFEKILVITHIDELKDAFPTRIDVVRNSDGSTIELN